MVRRLFRSRTQRVIGGVCGGLGEYFNIDPALIRVIFVILALINGLGIVAYLAMWLVFPRQVPSEETETDENVATGSKKKDAEESVEPLFKPQAQRPFWLGIVLIVLGVGWIFSNLFESVIAPIFQISTGGIPFPFVWWPLTKEVWPLSLIIGGILILFIKRGK